MVKTKAQELGITEFPYREFDKNGNITYCEYASGCWYKYKHDDMGNWVYYEKCTNFWWVHKYDMNRNITYWGNSNGHKEYIIR